MGNGAAKEEEQQTMVGLQRMAALLVKFRTKEHDRKARGCTMPR